MPTTYATTSAKKFLDANGLVYFSQKLNNYPTNDVIIAVVDGVQDALEEKADLVNNVVPVSQLPDAVYDVIEGSGVNNFPNAGVSAKLYIDTANNKIYRWNGTTYQVLADESVSAITDEQIDALFESASAET